MNPQIIKREGKLYQECGVIMLDYDKDSPIALEENGKLKYTGILNNGYIPTSTQKTKHLYITSDDEIKEFDWFMYDGDIYHFKEDSYIDFDEIVIDIHRIPVSECKKIIASTDSFLNLTSVSGELIQSYVDAYNKNHKIETVLVEYIKIVFDTKNNKEIGYFGFEYDDAVSDGNIIPEIRYKPKLKDKDIITKIVKNNSEVLRALQKFWLEEVAECNVEFKDLPKWVDDNF